MKALVFTDRLSFDEIWKYPETEVIIVSDTVEFADECSLTLAPALKEIHILQKDPNKARWIEEAIASDEPSGFLTDGWSDPDDENLSSYSGEDFDCSAVTIYVPRESVEAYRKHDSFYYFDHIEPEYLENPLDMDYGPYDVRTLEKQYAEGKQPEFLFFWGHYQKTAAIDASCLSQWYPAKFTIGGITYNCAEQYMMAEKARIFGDDVTRRKILAASDPEKMKALGRKVSGFLPLTWGVISYDIVMRGNMAKFTQNPELKQFLLSTQGKTLVEASPYDTTWGIGMRKSASANNPCNWKGRNMLGFALTEVRDRIKEEFPSEQHPQDKAVGTLRDKPTAGWAIIFAGGSASGKSSLIDRLSFKGEVLSTDTFGEKQIEIHNNASRFVQEDIEKFRFAESVVRAGLNGRFPDHSTKNKVQNLLLDFDSPTVKVSSLSALLSNGAHRYKKTFFERHISEASTDGMRNLILDMTGKEKEVNFYYDYLKSKGYKVALVWVVCNRNVALLWNAMRRRSMKVSGVHSGHNGPNSWLLEGLCDGRCDKFDDAWIVFNSTESIHRQMTEEEHKNSFVQLVKNNGRFQVPENIRERVTTVLGPNPDSSSDFVSSAWMKSFFARYRMIKKVAQEKGIAIPEVTSFIVSFLEKDKAENERNISLFYQNLGMSEPVLRKEPSECYDVNFPVREQFETEEAYQEAVSLYSAQKAQFENALKEWAQYNEQFEAKESTTTEESPMKELTFKYDFDKNPIDKYSKKVKSISETIQKAEAADVTPLAEFFKNAKENGVPVCFYGAGGAMSPSTFATQLANSMGIVAMTLTPMGVMALSPDVVHKMNFLAITATGKPADMVGATEYLLSIAPDCVYCLTTNAIEHKDRFGKFDNKVGQMVSSHNASHAICVNLSVHSDGFVGTNKHVGLSLLLYRAFHLNETGFAEKLILPNNEPYEARLPQGMTMADISDLHILYGATGRSAANDMEGRMLEAGVIPAMATDLKNFTHGRHVFLDKHEKSTILMLLSPNDESFAAEMLKLIPKDRPLIIIRTNMTDILGAIQLMICTFYLSIDICAGHHINPYSPGAPDWGGKLWALKLKNKK